MRHRSMWIAIALGVLLLVPAILAGCGSIQAGPHNDQERLVDQVLRGATKGDFQVALDAIPPEYIAQIREFMPDLSEQELEDMLITSIESGFKSAFGYTGTELVEVFYKTVSEGSDKAKVYYWGTLKYQENGETKMQTFTEKDAESEVLAFPVLKRSGRWYWDLESPN